MKYFFLILIILFSNSAFSQNECLENVTYSTSMVGDGKDAMFFPLKIYINMDTIKIAVNEKEAKSNDNVPFLITGKVCNWKNNYTEGESEYKLSVKRGDKIEHPTLTVKVKDGKGEIVLQYENKEPRVFSMIIQK